MKYLIIESTFTSIPDMAAKLYPFLLAKLFARLRNLKFYSNSYDFQSGKDIKRHLQLHKITDRVEYLNP